MRAIEFIQENKDGKLNKISSNAMTQTDKFKDDGSDRAYTLNRIMMATAVADGSNTKPVDINQASWQEDYNTAHPYTEQEMNMMQSAYNTVDSKVKKVVKRKESKEHPEVNTISPVTGFKGY
jgi:hypothetical protein